ncbi:hypothetical protein WJX74_010856 [Apatococcus lobatus]|uniref:Uncharacterized protein n=1 Tax=Apatococcus lobatus TaxID=904363 RepID=A0AAW1Q720_9CHLO
MPFTGYRPDPLALHESILLRQPAQPGWLVRSAGQPRSTCTRASASTEPYELRVCTNKTCKKQGSQQVLKFAQDLSLDEVKIKEVGCLGDCGKGPNMFLRPLDVKLNGMGSPARVTDLLKSVCNVDVPQSLLKATEKRLAGNREARDGNLEQAIALFTEGLEANPPRGKHLLYANRSGANLTLGRKDEALQDANSAAESAPADFSTAYIRQVEAYAAKGAYREAESSLHAGGKRCPAFASSPEFSMLQRALDKQLATAG